MKHLAFAMLAMVCLGMEPNVSNADEVAATAILPAALSEIGAGPSTVLSKAASTRVRASYVPTSGIRLTVSGTGKGANNSTINYQFAAGGQSTTIAFTPAGLAFSTQGKAVVGTAPPFQGVMLANTNVFQGVVAFQTASPGIQVVALPNQFMIVSP